MMWPCGAPESMILAAPPQPRDHAVLLYPPQPRSHPKPDRRRALELLASCRDGCIEAIMLAHGFIVPLMVELVRAGPHADARLRGDARSRDGGVCEKLAAGVVLRSGGRSAFGGKAKEAMSCVTDGGETCQDPMKDSVDPAKRALDTRV